MHVSLAYADRVFLLIARRQYDFGIFSISVMSFAGKSEDEQNSLDKTHAYQVLNMTYVKFQSFSDPNTQIRFIYTVTFAARIKQERRREESNVESSSTG
jgi:hypothetical protein